MHRRQLLQKTGAVALGGFLAMGTAAGRDKGKTPTGNVDTELVSIFAPEDDPRQVSAGSWLNHRWGWVDREGGDSTEEDVQRWVDAIEPSVYIDGEKIENPDQYWGDIHQTENGDYRVYWEYMTKPKPVGLYSFTVEFYYPEGYRDATDDEDALNVDFPAGHRETWTGYYEVTGGRGTR